MKNSLTTAAALLLTTTAGFAGGLDRSGQGIGILFEQGRVVELSYGNVTPDVTGAFGGAVASGNVAPSYSTLGLGFKMDIDDKVSVAVIMDNPFGAKVDYAETDAGYPIAATSAEVLSSAITVVGQYNVNENVSVHFGPRYLSAEGHYTAVAGGVPQYSSTYSSGSGTGFVAGAAYERQDIAMRVAFTYSSAISLDLDGTAGDLNATMPQSVNLDFQSGVAADTLVFGSVRWVEWSEAIIDDTLAGSLVSYDEDTISYTLGVGRKFSDAFSGALSIGYEAEQGTLASNLSPTDGNFSVSLGGTYDMGNGLELTGGVRYIKVGDATTETIAAEFADNSVIAIGLKASYSF